MLLSRSDNRQDWLGFSKLALTPNIQIILISIVYKITVLVVSTLVLSVIAEAHNGLSLRNWPIRIINHDTISIVIPMSQTKTLWPQTHRSSGRQRWMQHK